MSVCLCFMMMGMVVITAIIIIIKTMLLLSLFVCVARHVTTHTHKWAKSAAKCADIFVHFQLAD